MKRLIILSMLFMLFISFVSSFCLTLDQVQAERSKCLVIYNGDVYNVGSYNDPPQAYECGTEVNMALIAAIYNFLLNYYADLCTSSSSGTETCNNLDDDGDGLIDEDLNRTSNCGYESCASTINQTCSGGVWIPECTSSGTPEVCNNFDDDCDGVKDDNLFRNLTCGVGGCNNTVEQTCSVGVWSPSCIPGSPVNETCNGVDDNCDGIVDEGALGGENSCGIGSCKTIIYQECVNGELSPICVPRDPKTEVCNYYDDDCDGVVDEGCNCSNGEIVECGSDVGECTFGTSICVNGVWSDCIGGNVSVNETCNGLDDDCDGVIDNGLDCSQNLTISGNESNCTSNWYCTAWSDCDDGVMTRECTDENNCTNSTDVPLLEDECASETNSYSYWNDDDDLENDSFEDNESYSSDSFEDDSSFGDDEGSSLWLWVILGVLFFLLLGLVTYFVVFRVMKSRRKNQKVLNVNKNSPLLNKNSPSNLQAPKQFVSGSRFDQYWFSRRKSIFGNFSGIPLRPIVWEGYVTYVVLFVVALLLFFLLDVVSLELLNVVSFLVVLLVLVFLFVIISKNTTRDVVSDPSAGFEEMKKFDEPKRQAPVKNKRLPPRITKSKSVKPSR